MKPATFNRSLLGAACALGVVIAALAMQAQDASSRREERRSRRDTSGEASRERGTASTPGATNGPASGESAPLAAASAPSEKATNATAARLDYSAFSIISDRNIFNPYRSARTRSRGGAVVRAPRVDSIYLQGTISYSKGSFAFFDGSSSQYRKAVKLSETIAGYTIKDIGPNSVLLEANGKEVEFKVGSKMRREDDGEWQLSTGTSLGSSSSTTTSNSEPSASETSAAAASSSGSGEESDIVKKLMQQRELENSK